MSPRIAYAALIAASFAGLSGCSSPVELASFENAYASSCAVVVSKKTYDDAAWKDVADAMVLKRRATLIVYDGDDVSAAKAKLAARMPLYTAFVAKPEECGRAYVAAVHRMVADLDADPYEDTIWGVITGVDAAGAKRIALASRPPVIDTALGTTGLDLERFETAYSLGDGKAGEWASKTVRDGVTRGMGHDKPDAIEWKEKFEGFSPKLLVTSSHGYEHGFEMPFGRGFVFAKDGDLYALKTAKPRKDGFEPLAKIERTDSPRVWLAAGNCLVGHVDGKYSVTPTMLSHYGAVQVAGYTITTWNGAAGWGALDQWKSLPGRYSMSEAVWFNEQAMIAELESLDPAAKKFRYAFDESHEDGMIGDKFLAAMKAAGVSVPADWDRDNKNAGFRKVALLWDRDGFALYGDPMLEARLARPKADQPYTTSFEQVSSDRFRFVLQVNDPGAAADMRKPVAALFMKRIANPKIVLGGEYDPVVADNFILVRNPRPAGKGNTLVIEFEGEPQDDASEF